MENGEPQRALSTCASGLYQRLNESKRQIRLLELHPGSGDETISGSLITVGLPELPSDFDDSILHDELRIAGGKIIRAVCSGNRDIEDDVIRWESLQDSLFSLLRLRLSASHRILAGTHGNPTVATVGRLRGMRLLKPALQLRKITTLLTIGLLKCDAHRSWDRDLHGLKGRLCAQGTRNRHRIVHFARQMDEAVNRYISEYSDGVSPLTSVDVPALEVFLSEADLGSWPIFSAVSWFWGDATSRAEIKLDGMSLDVPMNAIRALRDLRDSDHVKTLWIDAVCINQDDKAERASQILLMGDIYSSAELTYVWLGNDGAVIQDAIVKLKDVLQHRQRAAEYGIRLVDDADANEMYGPFTDLGGVPLPRLRKPIEEVLRELPEGHQMTQAEWRSIFIPRWAPSTWALFELPWFGRLWVFQEAVLSRRCVVVFGPNTTLSWDDLETGGHLMKNVLDTPDGLDLITAVVSQRNSSGSGQSSVRLRRLVECLEDQECSDPRDHIFGLLGLTIWAKRRLRLSHLIQPNYTKPVSDCMRDATRVMIQEDRNLGVLVHWRQVGQSPTWAVHWHKHKLNNPMPFTPRVYGASEQSSRDPGLIDLDLMEKTSDLNILLVKGHLINFVLSTTPALLKTNSRHPTSWSAIEEVLRHIIDLSTRTGFEFSPHTIALTLIASTYEHEVCTSETEEFCRFECMVSNVWSDLHGRGHEQSLDFLETDQMLWFHFVCVCHNSRLFVTEAGQLCVGPAEVEEGDRIVRLFSVPLPVVLRPEQSWFTWRGMAYIDREFPEVHDIVPEILEIR